MSGNDDNQPKVTGPQVIADAQKRAPKGPGVYRMFDSGGDILYVGKARSIAKRIASYTRLGGQTNRIARMISETAAMEFVSTQTETEALLLEANMIKRLRPRYNVLLRDDKSFPYILIARDHAAPQLTKHRGARARKGDYFGPFASAGAVNRALNAMQRAFLLRTCSDSVYESRTRPCLLFQIKRCAAPCTSEISLDDYADLVGEATRFLSGKSRSVREDLGKAMEQASDALDFERAALLRDRLAAMSHVQAHQGINPGNIEEADVFAIHQEGGQFCIQVFFFRTGQNWGNRAYFPKADAALDAAEVLQSFLAQFYDDKPCPRLVLVSHALPEGDLLAEALSARAPRKVEISVPQRGEKRGLTDHALTNAREALGRRLAESASQNKLLQGVADAFGLPEPPKRIETYDNSHIMGTNAVGVMVVAGPEGFEKGQYRKFNIKSADLTPGDDYAMMREVLTRRFTRLLKENADEVNGERDAAWPDLVLIDGGKGQLSAATAVLEELGIDDVAVVGVAKGPDRDAGREHFFMPGKESFRLESRDPVLYYLQRLRDEAHRFAIGTHRARRKSAMAKNPLDEIAGIGPTRKRALLMHFGSAKAVSRAGLSDLEATPGINRQMARLIYDHFHEGSGGA
ncbi:MAG: excinuclease ABC subunit UvrC [Rhodobiaceae bacterium]|nr:excinuclease ABC subunit UvrC [Rhodobiaceae bacterium]MCC0042486.1 excinuclease ABC subunit UvrC [Rhodobiaceae bacterium]